MNKEEIEEKYGKVIKEFSTPHLGWELDTKGWICESKDKKDKFGKKKKIVILTDHGNPYIATKSELKKQAQLLDKYKKEIESASYYI